jgi:hypothetical protein
MQELIRRMSWEPEIFTLVDNFYIQVGGKSVLVRSYGGRRWSVIIHGGPFGKYGPLDVISYERLSWWQSRRVDMLAKHFRQTK